MTHAHKIAVCFLGALWLCFVATWLQWGQSNGVDERRNLAPMPRVDRTFPEGLGLYLRDHFGFRGWLIEINALVRVKVLRTSTSPEVILGNEGFLFFAGEGTLENYTGSQPMTDAELAAWVALFERRASWLRSQGIPCVVVVAPNKESVYPEMIPGSIVRGAGRSRLDRVMEALRQRAIPVIDPRTTLVSKKPEHRMYYMTDTHWSEWGAYWAYREILPSINNGEPVDCNQGTAAKTFDLTRMLGLNSRETIETCEPVRQGQVTGAQDDPLMTSESNAGPRLVFFRDSFGAALMPFLSSHFSRIYAPNGWTFDRAPVQKEHPDVVLLEIVERRFNQAPPIDPQNGPSN